MNQPELMTFALSASRVDKAGSVVRAKQTELVIDTGMAGRLDALNPVELLLAALSACMIKGIERVAETLGIAYDSVEISLTAYRPVDEARLEKISYDLVIGSSASQERIELLHKNLMKFGTIYNTVKSGTELSGTVRAK